MKDRVSMYPGRVKLVPVAGKENVYDMTREDSPTQEGTPLNKDSLLKDATAALFGLGSDAAPDDVLNLLSRFHAGLGNEYIWAKCTTKMVEQKGETISASGAFTGASFQYADSVSYSNGQVVLNAPQSGTIPPTESGGEYGFNKYIICQQIVGSNEVVYVSSASGSGTTWYYDYQPVYFVKRPDSIVGYINSPNANAYPPSVDDGYTYEYMGQLGGAPRIATGSYVGTNTYGVNAPNSLTFVVVPKILFIIQNGAGYNKTDACVGVCFPGTMTNGYKSNFIQMFQSGSFYYLGVRESTALAKIDGKTVSWYAGSAKMQLNSAGIVYDYIAIS